MDLYPRSAFVIRSDVMDFLRAQADESAPEIRSYNLIEHLLSPYEFLRECFRVLERGGRILLRTDNAEWLPFYLPLKTGFLGLGAHATNQYRYLLSSRGCNHTPHFFIFSKLHLRNLLYEAGFSNAHILREKRSLGARLIARAYKP